MKRYRPGDGICDYEFEHTGGVPDDKAMADQALEVFRKVAFESAKVAKGEKTYTVTYNEALLNLWSMPQLKGT